MRQAALGSPNLNLKFKSHVFDASRPRTFDSSIRSCPCIRWDRLDTYHQVANGFPSCRDHQNRRFDGRKEAGRFCTQPGAVAFDRAAHQHQHSVQNGRSRACSRNTALRGRLPPAISQARTRASTRSTRSDFEPGVTFGRPLNFAVGTAGSCNLVLHTLYCCRLALQEYVVKPIGHHHGTRTHSPYDSWPVPGQTWAMAGSAWKLRTTQAGFTRVAAA